MISGALVAAPVDVDPQKLRAVQPLRPARQLVEAIDLLPIEQDRLHYPISLRVAAVEDPDLSSSQTLGGEKACGERHLMTRRAGGPCRTRRRSRSRRCGEGAGRRRGLAQPNASSPGGNGGCLPGSLTAVPSHAQEVKTSRSRGVRHADERLVGTQSGFCTTSYSPTEPTDRSPSLRSCPETMR